MPIDAAHTAKPTKRTLTNLCNEHPTWLAHAHAALDAAVAAAYGWSADLTNEEVLARLLERIEAAVLTTPRCEISSFCALLNSARGSRNGHAFF